MSGIERIIDDIEAYVEDCKLLPMSQTKIIVNKEELIELLTELRLQIPDEVKQYQKIINNQDAILSNAKSQADSMVSEANEYTKQLVSDHEIMQRAYASANDVIEDANRQADQIISNATADANNIKRSIMKYSDEMLESLQTIMDHVIDDSRSKFDAFLRSMETNYEIVESNRNELAATNQDDQE